MKSFITRILYGILFAIPLMLLTFAFARIAWPGLV
jgi:hypothetical protein